MPATWLPVLVIGKKKKNTVEPNSTTEETEIKFKSLFLEKVQGYKNNRGWVKNKIPIKRLTLESTGCWKAEAHGTKTIWTHVE